MLFVSGSLSKDPCWPCASQEDAFLERDIYLFTELCKQALPGKVKGPDCLTRIAKALDDPGTQSPTATDLSLPPWVQREIVGAARAVATKGETLANFHQLVQCMSEWFKKYDSRDQENRRFEFKMAAVAEEVELGAVAPTQLERLAGQLNQLCLDLEICGRVCLASGSLWLIFTETLDNHRQAAMVEFMHQWQLELGMRSSLLRFMPSIAIPRGLLDMLKQLNGCVALDAPQVVACTSSTAREGFLSQMNSRPELDAVEAWQLTLMQGPFEVREWLEASSLPLRALQCRKAFLPRDVPEPWCKAQETHLAAHLLRQCGGRLEDFLHVKTVKSPRHLLQQALVELLSGRARAIIRHVVFI